MQYEELELSRICSFVVQGKTFLGVVSHLTSRQVRLVEPRVVWVPVQRPTDP